MEYTIYTSADRDAVATCFTNLFLARASARDYFKGGKEAALRRSLEWGLTAVEGADLAAEVQRGKLGGGPQEGVVFALSFRTEESPGGMNILHTWLPVGLAVRPLGVGILEMDGSKGLLKNYTNLLAAKLQEMGFDAAVTKLR